MKVINLNESQYKRLFEANGQTSSFVQTAGGNTGLDTTPGGLSQEQTWVSSLIGDEDGDKTFSDPAGALGHDPHAEHFAPNDSKMMRRNV